VLYCSQKPPYSYSSLNFTAVCLSLDLIRGYFD
jgi:hypothetical protein